MKLQGFLLPVLLAGFTTVDSARIPPLYKKQSNTDKALAVKEAFNHSWDGYVKYAFGMDELRPVSNSGSNSRYDALFYLFYYLPVEVLLICWFIYRNGWGASVVDALTTAIIMRADEAVFKQLDFITRIDFTRATDSVSLFETTIRYLGGLLSGYDLLTGPYADMVSNVRKLIPPHKHLKQKY